jgi:hypothetical protein
MRWPFFSVSRQDVLAIALGLVFAAVFMVGVAKFPWLGLISASNRGFGPDWHCTPTPQSEQVCIKRLPNNPTNRNAPSN